MNALDLDVDDLLILPEEDFVREAYRRLLARPAEPVEVATWLAPLRSGGLTRLELVTAIRCSSEARQREDRSEANSRSKRFGAYAKRAVHWLRQLRSLGRLAMRVRTLEATTETLANATAKLAREALPPTDALTHDRDARAAAQAFDAYYRRFEDRFRGTPEEVRRRLAFYVPILVAAAQPASAASAASVVDVGCGRGELLDLLRNQAVSAYGVERNEAMAAICRERGLAVVEADALVHLASLAPDSLAGVTCIHVIEHLPFAMLMKFVAHAMRVLRPGGVAILETPNPENLIVGACNFYFDPTHRRPLPPEPMRFLLEAAGFERVAIERLHASASPGDIGGAADPVAKLYTTIMLVPQDYALIGYKPLS